MNMDKKDGLFRRSEEKSEKRKVTKKIQIEPLVHKKPL